MLTFRFQLLHHDKLESILYQDRDLKKDFDTIFNIIKNDLLFISFKIELEVKFENHECSIRIHSFSVPSSEPQQEHTLNFLKFSINNKLALAGLDDHFYISGEEIRKLEGDIVVDLNFNPAQLNHIERPSYAEQRLVALNFPLEDVPVRYNCLLTSCMMDIPTYDMRAPSACIERRAFLKHVRQYHRHPTTNQIMYSDQLFQIDYSLRDKILTFIEKVEILHGRGKAYKGFTADLCDENLSKEGVEEKLGVIFSVNTDVVYNQSLRKAKECYYSGRFLSAAFYFEKASKFKTSQQSSNQDAYIECLLLSGIANLKANKLSQSLEIHEKVKNYDNSKHKVLYGVFLLGIINYHLDQSRYDLAEELMKLVSCFLQVPVESERYLRISQELLLFQQLKLLTTAHVKSTYSEQGKALRRLVAKDSIPQVRLFLRLFPFVDINSQDSIKDKKMTALHLALKRQDFRYEMSELLIQHNASLEIADASEKTPHQIILKDPDTKMKKLLEPHVILTMKQEMVDVNLLLSLIKTHSRLRKTTEIECIVDNNMISIKILPIFLNTILLENFTKFILNLLYQHGRMRVNFHSSKYVTPLPDIMLEEKEVIFTISVQYGASRLPTLDSFFHNRQSHEAFISYVEKPGQMILDIIKSLDILSNPSFHMMFDPSNHTQFKIKAKVKIDEQLKGFLLDYINQRIKQLSLLNFACADVEYSNPSQQQTEHLNVASSNASPRIP